MPDKVGDDLLVQYLLGALPEAECERFDELSVADDQVAWRLRELENDLVDAYVRGELSGATLERFRTRYEASGKRRQKVMFADALLAFENRAVSPPTAIRRAWIPQWGLAAAALLAVIASGYLFAQNRRLEKEVNQGQTARVALEQKAHELGNELQRERTLATGVREELQRLRDSLTPERSVRVFSFLLFPQMRGPGQIAAVSVPRTSGEVTLRLRLESDDFPAYEATLRDPGTGQAVWRGASLPARRDGEGKSVAVQLPTSLLKPQNYTMELSGKPAGGAAEFITSYAFRVMLQ